MQRYTLTWKNFQPDRYFIIEDPLFGGIDRETFLETYGPLLVTFDGRKIDAYLDFYFEQSPLNHSALVFRDAKCRDRFLIMAQQMSLVPGLKEIHEGESQKDVQRRRAKEEVNHSTNAKIVLKSQQTLAKLTLKLTTEVNVERKKVIEEKIHRITVFLASKHNTA